ncbi:DUF6917 domain-containing protein [Saccharothrix luteola]|uniref:DUF6917 domain-containing protein n=1 Tax=Saccharothrix luteola TaxID=2893018 RepID=UPI001E406EFB|nr:hypothetical protein [Saccharothrix luteola]MCC8246510.1 hypothetical protein [Saccharothrix luteola]
MTTDHDDTAAGARIDRVAFLGLVEIANAGVIDRGDEAWCDGETGPELGLRPEVDVLFSPAF